MTTTAPLGLRDKKRAETRARLERAAVELVLREGLHRATVDAISDAADVSSRTFFNYFDSKEDAILGIRDLELTDEALAEQLHKNDGADLLETVVKLLFWLIGPSITTTDLHAMRVNVVKAHPELLSRHVTQMTRMADQLTTAIQTLLANDPAFAADPLETRAATAEMVFAICSGGVRVVVKEWVTQSAAGRATTARGTTGAGVRATDQNEIDQTTTDQLEQRAIELVREVSKKIQ